MIDWFQELSSLVSKYNPFDGTFWKCDEMNAHCKISKNHVSFHFLERGGISLSLPILWLSRDTEEREETDTLICLCLKLDEFEFA